MRIKTAIVMGIIMGTLMQYSSAAEQPVQPTVTAVGNSDLLSLRVGITPWQGRTELGLYGIWLDGLTEDAEGEGFGGGLYATYDVVQDADWTIMSFSVPVTYYAGGQLGVLHGEDSDEDAQASFLTGLTFGDDRVRIGVEYSYLLDDGLWKEFGTIDDNHRLMLTLGWQF